jgi:hypothetical protein
MRPDYSLDGPSVIPCHPRESGGKAGIQSIKESPRSGSIIWISPLRGLFVSLDSRFRGNDGTNGLLDLKSQFVTSSWGGIRKQPYAFTEQGVAMLSGVLRSQQAVQVNIEATIAPYIIDDDTRFTVGRALPATSGVARPTSERSPDGNPSERKRRCGSATCCAMSQDRPTSRAPTRHLDLNGSSGLNKGSEIVRPMNPE